MQLTPQDIFGNKVYFNSEIILQNVSFSTMYDLKLEKLFIIVSQKGNFLIEFHKNLLY